MIKVKYIKEILIVSIPLIMQNTFRMMLGIVDKIFVGQLGEGSIAGVGASTQLYGLFLIVFFSFSSGLTILSSQYKGADDKKQFESILSTTFIISTIFSIIIMAIFHIYSRNFLEWMKLSGEALDIADLFFRINIPTILFMLLASNFSSVFLSMKKNVVPMLATFLSLGINTFLDWYFIFILKLGVGGVAWATVISRFIEVIILFIFMIRELNKFGIKIKPVIELKSLKKLLSISIPMSLDGAVWQFASVVQTAIILQIGLKEAAVFEIFKIFQSIALTPISSLSGAAVGIIGQELGAQKYDEAKSKSVHMILIAFSLVSFLSTIILISGDYIFALFKITPETFKTGMNSLPLIMIMVFAQTMNILFPFILRSGGDTWKLLMITIIGFWGLQIPLSIVLGITLKLGMSGVLIGMIISESIKGLLFMIRYLKGKWIKNLAVSL